VEDRDYGRLFDALPSPHLVLTPDLVVVDANPAYLDMVGTARGALVGHPVFEVFPPPAATADVDGEPQLARSFRRVLETRRPEPSFVARYDVLDPATGTMRERWWSHVVVPVLGEGGGVQLLVQRVDEVTGYVRAQEAALGTEGAGQTSLDTMHAELYARSLEVQAARDAELRTARALEAMPSGFFSLDPEWRFTLVNAAAERLTRRSRDQLLGRLIWEAFPDTVGNRFERAYRAAADTGVPQTIEAYYPAPLDRWFEVLCWPNPDGLSLYFADITDRTRAAEQAARMSARLAVLARVNDALVRPGGVEDAVRSIPRLVVPTLGDACVLSLLDETGRLRDVSWWHADPERRAAFAGYVAGRLAALPDDAPLPTSLSTGEPARGTTSSVARLLTDDDVARRLVDLGESHITALAVRGRDGVLGVLTVYSAVDRADDAEHDAMAQTIADRAGAALDNARLVGAQTALAAELQRSLLTDPPEPDHLQIAVRYVPAVAAAQVGGDWYDAFLQPEGATMLVIGDVAGHDTTAAAIMGQLRGLLRGIATYSGAGPLEVLRGLDASMSTLMVPALATAAVVRLEQTPADHEQGLARMVWANAGHPRRW